MRQPRLGLQIDPLVARIIGEVQMQLKVVKRFEPLLMGDGKDAHPHARTLLEQVLLHRRRDAIRALIEHRELRSMVEQARERHPLLLPRAQRRVPILRLVQRRVHVVALEPIEMSQRHDLEELGVRPTRRLPVMHGGGVDEDLT